MPIVRSFATPEVTESSADDILLDKRGNPTLEGQVVRSFIKSVDMDPLFDVPEIQEGIERYVTNGVVIGDTIWEAKKKDDEDDEDDEDDDDDEDEEDTDESEDDEDDEDDDDDDDDDEEKSGKGKPFGGKKAPPFKKGGKAETVEGVEVEIISGELAASIIDEDDLYGMFKDYILDMPHETMEERLKVQAIIRYLDEAEVMNEAPFAKGDFRKIYKGSKKTKNGLSGPAVVKSMLVAMMHKHAIKRAKAPAGYTPRGTGAPGKGYKGGDYEKDPAGYGAGTGSGRKLVMKFKKGHAAQIEKGAKKKKGYLKAKAAKEKKMVAAPKAPAKRGKAAAIAKKKPSPRGSPARGGGKGREAGRPQQQVAHDAGAVSNLHENYVAPMYEGASMAAQISRRLALPEEKKVLTEAGK